MKLSFYALSLVLFVHILSFSQSSENQHVNPISLQINKVYSHEKIIKNHLDEQEYLGSCFSQKEFLNSVWFYWHVDKDIDLELDIIPHFINNDIDFIVYLKTDQEQISLKEIRCMASGPILGSRNFEDRFNCLGITGLKQYSNLFLHEAGCSDMANPNFLEAISVKKNEELFIQVINVASTQGFDIELKTLQVVSDHNSEMDNNNIFFIYPNPVNNELYLEINNSLASVLNRLLIYDTSGKLLHNIKVESLINPIANNSKFYTFPVQVSHLPSGSYRIILQSKSGNIYSKPFIKMY